MAEVRREHQKLLALLAKGIDPREIEREAVDQRNRGQRAYRVQPMVVGQTASDNLKRRIAGFFVDTASGDAHIWRLPVVGRYAGAGCVFAPSGIRAR
nr:hypothetical protein [Lonsdalea populi]